MMNVLVTGAAGFIGRHLRALLEDRTFGVVGIDIRSEGLCEDDRTIDIRDTVAMNDFGSIGPAWGVHAIVHLAAVAAPRLAEKDPALAWSTNVQGTYNVLRLAQRLVVRRFVFISSAHVYGISPKYLPTDEYHPLALHDVYTSTKIAGEQLCRVFHENAGISYTTLRLFNGYGPGQSPDYFVGAKIQQAREGKLTVPWEPRVTKDWVHVSDIVQAILLALRTEYVGALNIGTGIETSLGEITAKIASHVGRVPAPADGVSAEGPTRMCADWKRARQVLGWAPQVAFEDGLKGLLKEAL